MVLLKLNLKKKPLLCATLDRELHLPIAHILYLPYAQRVFPVIIVTPTVNELQLAISTEIWQSRAPICGNILLSRIARRKAAFNVVCL